MGTVDFAWLSAQFEGLRVHRSSGRRSPHKPLVLLRALALVQQNQERLQPFRLYDAAVGSLIAQCSASGAEARVEYPFTRLRSDGDGRLWELLVPDASSIANDTSAATLANKGVLGGFAEPVFTYLSTHPDALFALAEKLLWGHFSESLHGDILEQVGLTYRNDVPGTPPEKTGRIRSAKFREEVYHAYEGRCAVCSFSLELCQTPIGIEAAHIRQFAYDGPDTIDNGMALCIMHHKLFDYGAFTLERGAHRILVSGMAAAKTSGYRELLGNFHGQPVNPPQRREQRPNDDYVLWHNEQVFRGQPRELTT